VNVAGAAVNNLWAAGQPLLSVIIPCFNYGHFVEEALHSVMKQTFRNLEIIVVDGGSTDPATLEKLASLEAANLPGVKFFYRQGRHLVGDNRNFGIAQARGRYVCCLDADDQLSPIYCEVALFLAEGFGYDIVYCSVQCFGASDFRWLLIDASFPGIGNLNQVSTVAVHRRSTWAHVGGYRDWGLHDQHVPEDWDYWMRIVGHGFRPKSIREPLFLYRVHNEGLTGTTETTQDEQRLAIKERNAGLFREYQAPNPAPVLVLNRWVNIPEHDDDTRPGFLLALPFATFAGAAKLLYCLAEALAQRGFRVVVTTSLILSDTVPDLWKSFEKITPHVYSLPRLFHDHAIPEDFVRHLIRRYRVGHLVFAGCDLIYRLIPSLRGEFPDLRVFDHLFNDIGNSRINRRYRHHIDTTIVASGRAKESLNEQTPDDPGKVHIVPYSVAAPAISSQSGDSIRAGLGLSKDRIIVAFFGHYPEEPGAAAFARIALKLAGNKRLFFQMNGDGPEHLQAVAAMKSNGLAGRLHAQGFVEDRKQLMDAADIVVVPVMADGMPLAVLESLAHEKAVVASSAGIAQALIVDGETGYLCQQADDAAFAKRIAELAGDEAKRRQFGKAGSAAVRENYNSEKMLRSYFEVLGLGAANGS
jgi:glycosyltransferase involved in cell wall biosynthesis